MTPRISVVVATHNRPQPLRRCLESLVRQNLPRDDYEVIVIDDGSDRPPAEEVEAVQDRVHIRLYSQKQGGPGPARNAGVARAAAGWVAFTDDDCEPATDWLAAMLACATACGSRVVGGRIVNTLVDNMFSAASQLLIGYLYDYFNRGPDDAVFFTSNNLAVPAAAFLEAGGFVIRYPVEAGEDREFCDRWKGMGGTLTYAPEAVVHHSHNLTLRTFCRQHFTYGRGSYTYHALRARRLSTAIRLEPLAFYSGLLTRPFNARASRPWRLALLMAVSQVANAAGFFYEVARHRGAPDRVTT